MGACCGGEDEKSNVNINKKNDRGKGAEVGATVDEVDSSDIIDYTNERVRDIYGKLGDYKEGKQEDSVGTEDRDLSQLENNAKYQGQWSSKENLRHGYGT
jgi:hypothetical protein